MSKYFDEVVRGTKYWAKNEETLFLGQSIAYKGNVLFNTLELANVPIKKRIELPVFEDVQAGMSIGLSLEGFIPISLFPRFDFLLCAMNQIINHIDKLPIMSNGTIKPKVIIKTLVGSTKPLHPGYQHCGDYTSGIEKMVKNIEVIKLTETKQVFPAYVKAIDRKDGKSTLIIEMADLYK